MSATTALPSPASTTTDPAPERLAPLDEPAERDRFTQWSVDGQGRRTARSSLRITGIVCAACGGILEAALLRVPGVLDVRVSVGAERAVVGWDPQRARVSGLVQAIERAGYGAVPDITAAAAQARRLEQRRALWRLFVAGFCMMQVMMVATPAYVSAPGEIEPDVLRLLQWAAWLLTLPVLLFSTTPFFAGAWRSLKHRRIAMEVPVALGIVVTFVASSGATFDPGGVFGSEVYFDSLSMFVFFLLGGRWLELRARHRVADALESAIARLPDVARRIDAQGGIELVPVSALRRGDHLRVSAGEAIPADGVVVEGRTTADEAVLTGESVPVVKAVGDELAAGSLNLSAPLVMRVDRLGADTRYEGIVAMMRDALTQRPAIVREADRWAAPFLWGVLVLALGAAAVWSVVDPSRAVWVMVSVLIVTCPCALSLATPSALLATTGAFARRGLLLRRLEAIEALSKVDLVFFDKTGTLTLDRLQAVAVAPIAAGDATAADEADLTGPAASLAAWSSHPAARAVAAATSASGAAAPIFHEVEEQPGLGLQGRGADGRIYRLGRAAWVDASLTDDGDGATVWFGAQGRALARFELAETLRPGAQDVVRGLVDRGVRVALLSGDGARRAQAVATRLGIADVTGGASPQDKLDAITRAQEAGHVVAMVGDGLNDAPVLARADVSLSFAHGAAVNRLHADGVLLGEHLGVVAAVRDHARHTMRVVRQNLAWAALYNLACVPLALAGLLPPWAAGLGMAASSLLVVGNALRLSRMPESTTAA
jgi:Cu2+-exporting ATPase